MRRWIAYALAPALAAAFAAGALAAPAPPRHGSLQAFVLASSPDSLGDLQAHAGQVGVVYPTYFDCVIGTGELTGADSPAITQYARMQHIPLMPRFNCQDGATVHLILTEPALRAHVLARLVNIARRASYAGLCLDFENDGAADREALSSFVEALARRLHARGRRLTVAVTGVSGEARGHQTAFYDYNTIAAAADSVFVMAWGAHWERSAPGPIAPVAQVAAVARYVASLPNASRFVLGVPAYGLDWPGRGGAENPTHAYQYAAVLRLAASVGAVPARDPASGEMTFNYTIAGVRHEVWYLDAQAIAARLHIARSLGLAVGLWRLGREDQAVWAVVPPAR